MFIVLAMMALAGTAFLLAGRVGALFCSLFLLCTPILIELSRYFKEDAALMLGVAFTFLAITRYQRRASTPNLLFLAISAAFAASGKHIGLMVLPFCFYTIATGSGSNAKRVLLFTAVTLSVYALFNYQAILHFTGVFNSISQECRLLKSGGSKVVAPRSSLFAFNKYMGVIRSNSSPGLLWFAGFALFSWWKGRREPSSLGQVLLFAASIFLLLSFIPKASSRYFLPVTAILCLAAGIGAARIFSKPEWKWKLAGLAIPLGFVLSTQGIATYAIFENFHQDTRSALAGWITKNLPANVVIAQEPVVLLSSTSDSTSDNPNKIPQHLIAAGSFDRTDALNSLLAKGTQYLIINLSDRENPMKSKTAIAIEGTVIQSIQAQCKLLWTAEPIRPRIKVVWPNLAIYKLPEALNPGLVNKAAGGTEKP